MPELRHCSSCHPCPRCSALSEGKEVAASRLSCFDGHPEEKTEVHVATCRHGREGDEKDRGTKRDGEQEGVTASRRPLLRRRGRTPRSCSPPSPCCCHSRRKKRAHEGTQLQAEDDPMDNDVHSGPYNEQDNGNFSHVDLMQNDNHINEGNQRYLNSLGWELSRKQFVSPVAKKSNILEFKALIYKHMWFSKIFQNFNLAELLGWLLQIDFKGL
nr:hypothetical protein Iba_chr01bCG3040 [Ipomoea batatas]